MPDTTDGGLPYPIPGDPVATWPDTVQDLAEAVEAHRGVMRRTTAQAIPDAVATTADFNASEGVIGLTVSLAANTFTAARDGFYTLIGGTEYDPNAAGRRTLLIMVDGAEVIRQSNSPGGGTAGHTVSYAGFFDAGTVFRLDVFQDSGGALNTIAGTLFLAVVQHT